MYDTIYHAFCIDMYSGEINRPGLFSNTASVPGILICYALCPSLSTAECRMKCCAT